LQAQVVGIERPEARALIHSTLKEMALADNQLKNGEGDLLRWLAETWRLES
jgi:hypothetical protein